LSELEKKKIELPKALREIVKLLSEESPLTYEEIATKLEKDVTTIIRQVEKLEELEIVTKVQKDNKAAVALKEDVEVDEEGNVYVPSPFEEPSEKLRRLLSEAGVRGKKLNFIMTLVESNPKTLEDPNELYDMLVGSGIRRLLAQQIVKAYFGTEFTPKPQYTYPPPYPSVVNPMIMGRDSLRLELLLDKLMDEVKELKRERSTPNVPMVRRVKTDETGKPVEIIEEPIFWYRSSDDSKYIEIIREMSREREELLKTIFQIQQKSNETIEKVISSMKEMQQNLISEMQKQITQSEMKRMEDLMKMKEELMKKETEFTKTYYEEKLEDLKSTIQALQKHYEEKTAKLLEDLKKEWEYAMKIKELEATRSVRDVVVSEIRETTKELREAFKELREQMREYAEAQMKQVMKKEVPQVSEEEKKKVLEVLKKKAGKEEKGKEEKKEEPKKEEKEEVKVQVVK